MNFLDSVNGYVPPDTNIAVGPEFVVEIVNSQIQFYDKATGAAMLPNTPLEPFFAQPGEIPFDPNVTYDDIAGRFIVTAIRPSATISSWRSPMISNPLDGFNSYNLDISEGRLLARHPQDRLERRRGGDHVQHVPGPGRLPRPGALVRGQLALLVDATPHAHPGHGLLLVRPLQQRFRDGPRGRCTAPSPAMPMYFVEENGFADGWSMLVSSATDLLSGSPSFTDTVVPVSTLHLPAVGAAARGHHRDR